MARAPRARPRKPRPPTRARELSPYIVEQARAFLYTLRWHRVARWADEVVSGFGEPELIRARSERVSIVHGQAVGNLFDADEAEAVAADLANVSIPLGPAADVGGRRRVLIRAFTWLVDEAAGGVLYQPQWITTGEGHSARAAAAAHNRYVRAYSEAVAHGVESRILSVTAIEVLWWTMSMTADYV